MVARQFVGVDGVDARADEVGNRLVGTIGAFKRRCQAQPIRRGQQAGDVLIAFRAEVMDLVEDDEPKVVAEFVSPQVGRIVGRHGHTFDALLAATEPADGGVELGFEFALPLLQEVDGGHDDESRFVTGGYCGQRDHGFTRAGRQFEDAAAVVVEPRVEGVLLILTEFVARRQRDGIGVENGVIDIRVDSPEYVADRRVVVSRRAGRLASRVGFDPRQAIEGGIALAVALDVERAVLEAERNRHGRQCGGGQ
ncbi:MAG: hypothetical protein A07HN63_02213 [uncultured archaeon A07HN63]|nr:MAG: hypothetical protein A07HN63_02213 [uncultured archaeon A07HN63]